MLPVTPTDLSSSKPNFPCPAQLSPHPPSSSLNLNFSQRRSESFAHHPPLVPNKLHYSFSEKISFGPNFPLAASKHSKPMWWFLSFMDFWLSSQDRTGLDTLCHQSCSPAISFLTFSPTNSSSHFSWLSHLLFLPFHQLFLGLIWHLNFIYPTENNSAKLAGKLRTIPGNWG